MTTLSILGGLGLFALAYVGFEAKDGDTGKVFRVLFLAAAFIAAMGLELWALHYIASSTR